MLDINTTAPEDETEKNKPLDKGVIIIVCNRNSALQIGIE